MTLTQYLHTALANQTLALDSKELQELQSQRKMVETILREHFLDSSPSIRYGGSMAKNTLIKDAYDLDIICYFEHDDSAPGENLREVYSNVQRALSSNYDVQPKTSALRLRSKQQENYLHDYHIDVVPGRFVDANRSDCYIYQTGSDKTRLKTNIDTHVSHIRDSGLTPIIRVMKLWNVQNSVRVKTFVLELLVVQLLRGNKSSLGDQFIELLNELSENVHSIHVEDPANPHGNDLSVALNHGVRLSLSSVAAATLSYINDEQYIAVFGNVAGPVGKAKAVASIVTSVGDKGTRPWCQSI